jgi:two-component sensor histidine kinase
MAVGPIDGEGEDTGGILRPIQAMYAIRLSVDLDQCEVAAACACCEMTDRAANPQEVRDPDAQDSGHSQRLLTIIAGSPARRTLEACERELIQQRSLEIRLRDALAESEAQLRQKDELIQQQELLSKESDHRLMNDLQMTISLLSLQSRGSTNAEAAAQLAVAANRVAMIARIHHRLHSYDGVQAINFRKFLEDFARDFSATLSSDERPEQVIVEGIEINLPAATAIPLGFIVSELIANAAKYGNGRIAIRLLPDTKYGYALSVSNDGPALPEGFDPGASKGLGMKIVQSFTRQIGGELRIERGDEGQGARFTVLFS